MTKGNAVQGSMARGNAARDGAAHGAGVSRRGFCAAGIAGALACAFAAAGRPGLGEAAAVGAAGGPDAAEPREGSGALPATVVDDRGCEVVVESLERVVVCMGSFAKTWELAGGTLAGTTGDAFEDYDLASAGTAVSVGDFTSPDLEQILALDPTLVVMSASSAGMAGKSTQVDLAEPLEAAGIPVVAFKVTTFGDYLRMLRACCDLTGRDDLYEANGAAVGERVDDVVAAAKAALEERGSAPTCLVMTTYSGGTRVAAPSSQVGSILSDLGAANLTAENPSLLKDFSLESVIAMDPDFIFVLPMGNTPEAAEKALYDQTEANPAWSGLTAVREGRFTLLDEALFLYKPLNEWDRAYREMAVALYGDAVLERLPETAATAGEA